MRANEPGDEPAYVDRLTRLMESLPTVLLVRNAGEFRGRLLGDEEVVASVERA